MPLSSMFCLWSVRGGITAAMGWLESSVGYFLPQTAISPQEITFRFLYIMVLQSSDVV